MAALRQIKVVDLMATWAGLPAHIRNDTQIASLVVKHFLGLSWIDKHIDPDATNLGILTLKGSPAQLESAKIRIVDLAESLFNLRKTKGLDVCIAGMKAAKNLEPSLAELHIGKMLYANDWKFRFVAPQGKRGDNYDLQIRYFNQTVCADVVIVWGEGAALGGSVLLILFLGGSPHGALTMFALGELQSLVDF
jgi:hypothetical protein